MRHRHLVSSVTCDWTVLPALFVEDAVFSPMCIFLAFLLKKNKVAATVGLFYYISFFCVPGVVSVLHNVCCCVT